MTQTAVDGTPYRWRFVLGIASFIAAFAVHLITLAAMGIGASPAAVSAIGAVNFVLNKVLVIASAAFLGRAGFDQLKALVFGTVRRLAFPDEVSPLRYRVGLLFLVVPIVLAWVAPYVAEFAPSIGRNTVRDGVISDMLVLVGLVMLGGDFWDKLRALFLRDAKAVFPA
ncbi:hypothetical protein [Aestuariivirga sp.]|uniref:hypothetical protein n=1 Tax=Aestuariivirga sp. TaxID=2650926 RepID=UPI00391B75B5